MQALPAVSRRLGVPALCVVVIAGLFCPLDASAQSLVGAVEGPVLEVGDSEGRDELIFGHVTDVAVTPGGSIVVVDNRRRRVSAFSPDGEVLGIADGPGDGSESFVHPAAVAMVEGAIFVLDNGSLSIAEFRLEDHGLSFQGSRRLDLEFFPEDFCVSRDRVFVLGYHQDAMVHEFSTEGHHLGSFGAPFNDDPVVAASLPGWIHCVEGERPAIAVASVNYPRIDVYEPSGDVRWSTETLSSFVTAEITRSPRGSGKSISPPANGDQPDQVVALFDVGDELVVQWGKGFAGMTSREDVTHLTTAALRIDDGEVLEVSRGVPLLKLAVGGKAYGLEVHPFPTMRVYQLLGVPPAGPPR